MNNTLKVPIPKPRNPLVPLTKTRSGAGKHKNRKKEIQPKHKEQYATSN